MKITFESLNITDMTVMFQLCTAYIYMCKHEVQFLCRHRSVRINSYLCKYFESVSCDKKLYLLVSNCKHTMNTMCLT